MTRTVLSELHPPAVQTLAASVSAALAPTLAGRDLELSTRAVVDLVRPYVPEPAVDGEPLTPRELQCLRLLAQGRTTPQIGRELAISENSVKVYLRHLYRRLGCHDRAQAVARGYDRGILVRGASNRRAR